VCDVGYVSGTAGTVTGTARVTGADESLLDVGGWEEEEEEEEEATQSAMTLRHDDTRRKVYSKQTQ